MLPHCPDSIGILGRQVVLLPDVVREIVELRRGSLPVSVFVLTWTFGPLFGGMNFQLPSISGACRRAPPATRGPPGPAEQRGQVRPSLSGAGAAAGFSPASAASEASKSTWLTSAPTDVPGLTRPGQRTRTGRACRPRTCCTCRRETGPAGLWPPSFSTASSRVAVVDDRAVVAGEDHQRVLGQPVARRAPRAPRRRDQSSSSIASPRGPIPLLPANRGCGTRGTWMSWVAK